MSETATGWTPSGNCSLFVCDVASFGHPGRTNHIQRHIRVALYRGLRRSFDAAGVGYDRCYREDRGDGVMLAIPPTVDTAVLLTSLVDLLRVEVRRYNEVSSEQAQMRLRVAVNTGQFEHDDNGLVGAAVNHTFRILEARQLKDALRDSGAQLALVVSERVHEDVVRHGRGLVDPDDYRRVDISVKETTAAAWIRIPGLRGSSVPITPVTAATEQEAAALPAKRPAPPERRPTPLIISFQPTVPDSATETVDIFRVVDSALEIPLLRSEQGRQQIVGVLSAELASAIPRRSDARSDTYAIVRTCLDYPGGLQELLIVIRGFVGGSLAMHELERSVARLLFRP
jgi:hypothetical protein